MVEGPDAESLKPERFSLNRRLDTLVEVGNFPGMVALANLD